MAKDIKVFFLGDIYFNPHLAKTIIEDHSFDIWENISSIFTPDLIKVVNLDFAFTSVENGKPNKWATLKVDPRCGQIFNQNQFVAIIGNNHISDFGITGVNETKDVLRNNNVLMCGYGENIPDAIKPLIIELYGKKIAFLSFCCITTNGENLASYSTPGVAPLSLELLEHSIKNIRNLVDIIFVYMHWGIEQCHFPVSDQIRLAHSAIDVGADFIAGTHAHVIQGYENYKDKWIFYGLGNFMFSPINILSNPNDPTNLIHKELNISNKESLGVLISIDFDSDIKVKLEKIIPFGYDNLVPPYIKNPKDLSIDIDHLNETITNYSNKNNKIISERNEPIYITKIINGIPAYFYSHPSIDQNTDSFNKFIKLSKKVIFPIKSIWNSKNN